ncbi:MAG: type II secretion system F family protein [Caldilineaceae bacterium]|nr:type II secretion system F family protein [Caldilineaceae bacterium]
MSMLIFLAAIFTTIAILFAFIAIHRWARQGNDVERRLAMAFGGDDIELRRRNVLSDQVNQKLGRLSMTARLERQLAAADIKITAAEFIMIRFALVVILFLLGWMISGYLLGGLLLSGFGWLIPGIYLKNAQAKRSREFAAQLPDMLNLLVGSLRAGYGLLHACNVVKDEMPEPISSEFTRVIREVSLGFNITTAFDHMVARLDDEDLSLIVTSIHVQNEVGGSLADVLESISSTIRERIKLKGQIRVMTSQQRATGWVLTGLPLATGTMLMMLNPDYMMEMFQPGWPILIPISATIMVFLGNIVMRWVMQIDY